MNFMWYAMHYAVLVILCDAWPYGLCGQYSLYSKNYCDICVSIPLVGSSELVREHSLGLVER